MALFGVSKESILECVEEAYKNKTNKEEIKK